MLVLTRRSCSSCEPSSQRLPWRRPALAAVGLLWLVAAVGATAGATPLALAVVAPPPPVAGGTRPPEPGPAFEGRAVRAFRGGASEGSANLGPDSREAAFAGPSPGVGAATRVPLLRAPVDGPLVRGFEEPSGRFGPGHRGVDFGAAPGAPVRPPAGGRVIFAGLVAGTAWVTIEVAPGVLVTLGPLQDVVASPGGTVGLGSRLAALAPGHGGHGGRGAATALHLGLRVDGRYVDPLPWLAGLARPRLAPLLEPGGPH